MPVLCFLDLATKTGWACGSSAGDPHFGTHVLPSTGEDIGRFVVAFDTFLNDLIAFYKPDYVAFEAPIHGGARTGFGTARKLLALASHTEFVCRKRSVRCEEAHLMTVKKQFAGSGRADKQDMIHIAKRYGWNVKSDHEADALAGFVLAVCKHAPQHAKRFLSGPLGARPLEMAR